MKIDDLMNRCDNKCELCGSSENLELFIVDGATTKDDENIVVCEVCQGELGAKDISNANHFRCLSDSMWSSVPAVQVVAYRTLFKLAKEQDWARDLLEMLYLDDELLLWAKEGCIESENSSEITKDSNGNQLFDGDSVTIIKDLDVKGANFVAKRGTIVKNIHLASNPEQIEGKVNGTSIVLLSCFLKRVQE